MVTLLKYINSCSKLDQAKIVISLEKVKILKHTVFSKNTLNTYDVVYLNYVTRCTDIG